MKTKIFPFILLAFTYLVPFRYAVLDPTKSNTINLLCMVATVFGTLLFMGLTMTDGERKVSAQVKKENATVDVKSEKQAA
jgi:hypothetical protein